MLPFLRINGNRQSWIKEIESYQTISTGSKKIYICDLHFDSNDLVKNGKFLHPKKNIVPKFRYI